MLVGLLVSGAVHRRCGCSRSGIGAVALFIGVSMLAPKLVPPLVQGARLAGDEDRRRRRPARRGQRRRAIRRGPPRPPSALMIGLALVTLVGVLAAGLRTAFKDARQPGVRRQLRDHRDEQLLADQPLLRERAAQVPGRDWWSPACARGDGKAFGSRINVTGVRPERQPGDQRSTGRTAARRRPAQLGQRRRVRRQGLRQGPAPAGRLAAVGRDPDRLGPAPDADGITHPPKGGIPYGDVTISQALFDREYQNPQNLFTFVNMQGGVTPANTPALNAALTGFPDAKVQTKSQFINNQLQGLTRCSTCSTCCCRCRSSSACSGSSTRSC